MMSMAAGRPPTRRRDGSEHHGVDEVRVQRERQEGLRRFVRARDVRLEEAAAGFVAADGDLSILNGGCGPVIANGGVTIRNGGLVSPSQTVCIWTS
jgi:hypothetical protein